MPQDVRFRIEISKIFLFFSFHRRENLPNVDHFHAGLDPRLNVFAGLSMGFGCLTELTVKIALGLVERSLLLVCHPVHGYLAVE
jgi:hypothetical protein